MASWSSEFSVPNTTARIRLTLTVTVSSQSIPNNTSTLSWSLKMVEWQNGSPWNSENKSTASVTVDSTVYSASNLNYNFSGNNQTINVASGTKVVTHAGDGTKSVTLAASYNGRAPIGTASIDSFAWALPTIPRATTPTVAPTSGNTGSAFVITHTPAVSTFYHDIAYSLDDGSTFTNIATNVPGTTTTTSWTPPHTYLPNVTSKVAVLRVKTYASSGGTLLGEKTVNATLNVPGGVVPTVSAVTWADEQVSAPDIPTMMGGAGRFLQGWSLLKPTVTSAGAGGSTVTSTAIALGSQTTTSGTAFANPTSQSGSVPFSAVATDSRGRASAPFLDTVSVKSYLFPNLATPLVVRTSDAAGLVPAPTGTYLRITPAVSVSSLDFGDGEKNLLEWKLETRPRGGTWTEQQAWTASGVSGNTWTTPVVISGYSAATQWDVRVSVRDVFGKNGYNTAQTVRSVMVAVPSEAVFMDWNSGIGVALGQYHSGTGARLQVADGVSVTSGDLEVADDIVVAGDAYADTSTATPGKRLVRLEEAQIASIFTSGTVDPARLPAATTTTQGVAPKATQALVNAGTDNQSYVTPLTLAGYVGKRVLLTSSNAYTDGALSFVDGIATVTTMGNYFGFKGVMSPENNYLVRYSVRAYTPSNGSLYSRLIVSGTHTTANLYYMGGNQTATSGGATSGYSANNGVALPIGAGGATAGYQWFAGYVLLTTGVPFDSRILYEFGCNNISQPRTTRGMGWVSDNTLNPDGLMLMCNNTVDRIDQGSFAVWEIPQTV